MRNRIKKALAVICACSTVLTLFGCGKSEPAATPTDIPTQTEIQNTVTTAKPDDSPVFMLEKLPEIGGYVDDIIYKRRYPETRDTLTPGEDYGKLIPFIGSFRDYHFVNYETGEWEENTYSVSKYGLMTDKGEIVVDAVYDRVNIDALDNGEYFITLSMNGEDFETVGKKLVCNSDGSWAKATEGEINFDFSSVDEGIIIVTDRSNIDWENSTGAPKTIFYDTDWNKLFEFENSSPHSYNGFSEGYIAMEFFTDYSNYEYETRFVDKNGNLAFDGIYPNDNFKNGKAPAKNASGLRGLYSIDGKWIVHPIYDMFYSDENYYIARSDFSNVIYDSEGNDVKIMSTTFIGDRNIEVYGDRLFLSEFIYNSAADSSWSEYTRLSDEKVITCKETGLPVTNYVYGTEYFYCDDGTNTYIVNFDGKTVAKLEGVGEINKIDDNHFEFRGGSWKDTTRPYSVYSFNGFKKLWSDTITYKGYTTEIWSNETYIVRSHTEEGHIDDYVTKHIYEILEIETGKPIFENLSDYHSFEINGETYFCVSDGTYTYTYAPNMTMLMKVRNESND